MTKEDSSCTSSVVRALNLQSATTTPVPEKVTQTTEQLPETITEQVQANPTPKGGEGSVAAIEKVTAMVPTENTLPSSLSTEAPTKNVVEGGTSTTTVAPTSVSSGVSTQQVPTGHSPSLACPVEFPILNDSIRKQNNVPEKKWNKGSTKASSITKGDAKTTSL
ncbi:hypothetical protein K7X08_020329 [Anisodus acutangulus]|uniref:Uncharacterized protein n=1 Tax=Anisodus acutangulus TaxID=402998 RepID=A0A9Q1RC77_9SOLA|nr:hypothetical protein K7X08_020329 [Anisodus acutangulus]